MKRWKRATAALMAGVILASGTLWLGAVKKMIR